MNAARLLQASTVDRAQPCSLHSYKVAMGLDGLFEREVRHDGIALCLASLRTYYMAAIDAELGAASEPEPVLTEDAETEGAHRRGGGLDRGQGVLALQAPVSDLQAPTDLEARTDLEAPTVGVADLLEAWRARLVSPRSSVPHEVVDPKPASLETAAAVAAAAVAKAAAAEAEAGAAEAASGSSEPRSWSVLDEVRAQLVAERVRRQQCEAELVALGISTDAALDRQRSVAERGIRELQGEVARLQGEVARLQERAAVKEQAYAVEEVEGSQQSQQSAPQIPRPQAAEQESVQDGLRDREALARIGTALPLPMDLLWQTSRSSTGGLPPCGPRDSASSPRHASETYDGQDRREHVGLGLPRLFVYATWVAIYAATIYATLAWLSVAPQTEALDTQLE